MPDQKPPALVFSHFGFYTAAYQASLDFCLDVLGFGLSDEGYLAELDLNLGFTTRRPFEHHQLVVIDGRDPAEASTIDQIGFLVPDLAELQRIHGILDATPAVGDLVAIDHGIAWTVYATIPGGVRISFSVDTPWYVPQPQCWPVDLTASETAIRAATEANCRAVDGFRGRTEWRADIAAELMESGRLLSQATRGIAPANLLDGTESVFKKDLGNDPDPAFPKIAMHRVGLLADDPTNLAAFYIDVLGYLETGRGQLPSIGAMPETDAIYLTRDPDQFAQLIITGGRPAGVSTSVNQLTFRVPSLDDLRDIHDRLRARPDVGDYRPVHHGNSFSLYCSDPEGNRLELSFESEWYIPAPAAWPLDFSLSNDELMRISEEGCRKDPGFMMREEWKQRARTELIAAGRLEAEELVAHT